MLDRQRLLSNRKCVGQTVTDVTGPDGRSHETDSTCRACIGPFVSVDDKRVRGPRASLHGDLFSSGTDRIVALGGAVGHFHISQAKIELPIGIKITRATRGTDEYGDTPLKHLKTSLTGVAQRVDIFRLHERQDRKRPPTRLVQPRRPRGVSHPSETPSITRVLMVKLLRLLQSEPQLTELIETGCPPGRLPRRRDRRHQQPHQDCKDADPDEQFDERKCCPHPATVKKLHGDRLRSDYTVSI